MSMFTVVHVHLPGYVRWSPQLRSNTF